MNPRRTFSALVALLSVSAISTAAGEKRPPATPAELVQAFVAASKAKVGAHVVRLADGEVLLDVASTRPLIPASNQKLLTAAVALKRLGPDFRFRTTLAIVGDDLVVFGDGDPTTGDARLAEQRKQAPDAVLTRWAQAVKNSGLARMPGNLVIRGGIFQPPSRHPNWPRNQLDRWYAAPVAGVNYNDNCLDVSFTIDAGAVRTTLVPSSRFLPVDNQIKLGKTHLWECRFAEGGARVTLSGTVARGSAEPLSVAVPHPEALLGLALADRLAEAGVEIAGSVVISVDPADARGPGPEARLLAVESTPLADALSRANKQSLNMMAECIFLRSAAEGGEPATWEKAAAAAAKVLAGDYGLPAAQFTISDGSGLSNANRVSPAAVTTLLRALAGRSVFVDSLSVAGEDGSLERRFDRPVLRERVLGKTGTIAGVSALSGYVLDREKKPAAAFSVIVNGATAGKNFNARQLQMQVCEALIADLDGPRPAGGKGK